MYDKFLQNKNAYRGSMIADQEILNDVANGKIGYMPMKFGLFGPFVNDKHSDKQPYNTFYNTYYNFLGRTNYKEKYPFLPKDKNEMNLQGYNPIVIHQWNGKWMGGGGLSIYRRIAQYYIKYAGIWDEICHKTPRICIK